MIFDNFFIHPGIILTLAGGPETKTNCIFLQISLFNLSIIEHDYCESIIYAFSWHLDIRYMPHSGVDHVDDVEYNDDRDEIFSSFLGGESDMND